MGLMSSVKNRARKWLGVQELSSYGGWWMSLLGSGTRSSAGVVVTPERAMQVATVYACVRVLSESIASLPLFVYERIGSDRKEKATGYTLYEVLRAVPNKWQTSFEFREMLVGHLCLRGNFYARIVPGMLGAVTELIPLHPDRMKVEMLENGRLRYVYTDERGIPEPYNQDEIFHVRGLSCDGLVGISPIAAARNSIGLAIATEDYGSTLFKNGARPGVVFSSDQPIKQEAADKIRESWDRAQGGSENQHKTAIMPFGLKPIQLGLSNDDAQFLDTRKFQRSEICGIFRVPPHMIGDLERATFSNIEEQNISFVQDALLPLARRIEGCISRDLIADDEKYFAEFLFEGRLRGNAAARSTFYREMWNLGVFSVNEIRAFENMNPIGDEGDKRFVQINMTTLEKAGEEPIEPVPEPEPKPQLSNTAAIEAAKLAMRAEADRLKNWEVDAINRLAAKPAGFLTAVDEFYRKHEERHAERLRPLANIVEAAGGELLFEQTISGFLDSRQSQVVEAAGTCTAANLKTTIEKLTATWIPKGADNDAA